MYHRHAHYFYTDILAPQLLVIGLALCTDQLVGSLIYVIERTEQRTSIARVDHRVCDPSARNV